MAIMGDPIPNAKFLPSPPSNTGDSAAPDPWPSACIAAKVSSCVLRPDSTVALAGLTGYFPGMLFWKGVCLVWTTVWPGALTVVSAASEPAGSPWRAEAAVTAPGYAWLPWLGLGAAGALVVLGFLWWRNRRLRRKLKQPALELPFGEARYRTLFDDTPVQILEEDFTAVVEVFSRLRAEGITHLMTHLGAHPDLPREWLGLVRLADANRPAIAAAGCASKQEMIARFSQLTVAPYPEIFDHQLERLWNGHQLFEEEFRYLDADGQERTCLMQCKVGEREGQPDLSRVVLVLLDITTAKRTVAAQMENQEVLRQILGRANILLWWASVRREGGHMRWKINIPSQSFDSPLFQLATARDRGGLWEVDHAPDLPETSRRAEQALLNNRPGYQQEFRVLSREGTTHWLSEEVGISRLGEEEWSLVGVVTDITARHEAEEARKDSEAQLQQILARADCMLWRANVVRDGTVTRWRNFDLPTSGLYTRLQNAGVIPGDGRLWPKECVPQRPEMDARAERAILSGAPGYEQEFHVIKGQQSFWMHEQVMIIPVGPDEWNLVGVLTDVTARHEAEEARKTSEAQLRQILTQADCLLWQAQVKENAAGVLDWFLYIPQSSLYWKLFGNDPSEHPNLMWSELNVPELAAMNARSTAAIRGRAPGYEQEFRAMRKGRTYWLNEQVSITPVGPDEWNLVGVITDISARRAAELALAAEKERLIVTLRAMTEGVITTDTRGVVQFMNRAAAELTQRAAATAVGRPLAEICILHEAPSNRVFTLPVMSVLEEGVLVDLPPQIMLVGRKGATCLVEGCCIPVREANSELIGTVLVLRDVTVRQRFEQELQRASRLESVGILAGGIAHDFNNILTAIMGNVTLALLDAEALSKTERYLREAERATLRARDLTQQLLTFAKGGDPVRSAVLLPEIIAETTQFALHGSRVKCEFDLPANLWPADADKAQLGQVVQNLVINATQAMPEGGTIRISAHNEAVTIDSHRSLAPGDYIHLIVTDTGTGIRAEHLVKIFDPYFTTKQQGSGLGLTTVYSIIKKHNGHIEVESELGSGTTFHFWLPALREQQLDLPEQQKEIMSPLKGRVLFMDDEEPIVQMASILLQRLGFEVEVSHDGAEAVQKFKAAHATGRPFDLVVMDLTVPGGMGGRETIGQLRLIDPGVKAVVSSGYSSDPVLANYRAYGFRGMVAKPYKIDDFTRVLREVMSGSRPPIPIKLPGQLEGR
jgi:signal transduction histidine kinase/CheY-like chemotaxis protein